MFFPSRACSGYAPYCCACSWAQSASRTFLARLADPGTGGELFGLYSTTGRATSFLAPMLFGLCVSIMGAQIWGVLGIPDRCGGGSYSCCCR